MGQGTEQEEIRTSEQRWNEAIARQDPASARQFMSEDYVLVGVRSTGTNTVDREQWLQGLAEMTIREYHAEVKQIRVYETSAVVLMEGAWHIDFRGQEIDEQFLLTDVWTRQANSWNVVLRHSSPFPRRP